MYEREIQGSYKRKKSEEEIERHRSETARFREAKPDSTPKEVRLAEEEFREEYFLNPQIQIR